MSRESLHSKFLETVKALNLAFPVAEIAEKMGVGQPIVSTYLNSKRNVSPKFVRSFCEAFGLDQLDGEQKEVGIPQDGLTDRDLISMFLTVSRTQTAILDRIEKQMARESSLQEVLAGVETIADRQGPAIQKILAGLDELRGRGKNPS